MKKLSIIILLSIAFAEFVAEAQNIQFPDMIRFSQTFPWGTARSMGMGGAFGALGADQSSISTNPAGIGVFRSSDFSFTLSLADNNSNSTYEGHQTTDFSAKLKVENFGAVFTKKTKREHGLLYANFGITYNRLNDFNRNVIIKNPNASSSLLDEFDYYANNQGDGALATRDLSSFYEGLAWDSYLLDTMLYGPGWYHSDFSDSHTYGQNMVKKLNIRGGIGQWDFAYGMNFNNMLYMGLSIGIQNFDYTQTSSHTETDVNGNIPNLQSFTFSEYLNASGYGGNFKIGVIVKPVSFIRLGAAIHSPTFYAITSDFHTSADAYYDIALAGDNYDSYNESDYIYDKNTFITPWKYIESVAFQFKQFGLLSLDFETVDYSSMKLSGDEIYSQNDSIKGGYAANNLRLGAEGKIGPFALRAGLGLYGSPNNGFSKINYKTYSAGIGFRGKKFYWDLAYVLLKYSNNYTLYQYTEQQGGNGLPTWTNSPQIAKIDNNVNRFVATIGFRF
jgi:hypothetical protein